MTLVGDSDCGQSEAHDSDLLQTYFPAYTTRLHCLGAGGRLSMASFTAPCPPPAASEKVPPPPTLSPLLRTYTANKPLQNLIKTGPTVVFQTCLQWFTTVCLSWVAVPLLFPINSSWLIKLPLFYLKLTRSTSLQPDRENSDPSNSLFVPYGKV